MKMPKMGIAEGLIESISTVLEDKTVPYLRALLFLVKSEGPLDTTEGETEDTEVGVEDGENEPVEIVKGSRVRTKVGRKWVDGVVHRLRDDDLDLKTDDGEIIKGIDLEDIEAVEETETEETETEDAEVEVEETETDVIQFGRGDSVEVKVGRKWIPATVRKHTDEGYTVRTDDGETVVEIADDEIRAVEPETEDTEDEPTPPKKSGKVVVKSSGKTVVKKASADEEENGEEDDDLESLTKKVNRLQIKGATLAAYYKENGARNDKAKMACLKEIIASTEGKLKTLGQLKALAKANDVELITGRGQGGDDVHRRRFTAQLFVAGALE
jgi:hypothetical protein